MHKDGHQSDDDQPDDRTELCAGEPPEGACLATQLVVPLLLLLVVSEIVGQETVAFLEGQLGRRALCDILRIQQTGCSSLS